MKSLLAIIVVFVGSLSSSNAAAQQPAKNKTSPCFESSILSPSPFMGNNGEVFKLSDGSLWEVRYEYEYLYEYYPSVLVCPATGKISVKGKPLNVARISGGPTKGS